MTEKHFIALADALRRLMPRDAEVLRGAAQDEVDKHIGRTVQWRLMRDALADFYASQDTRFDRKYWLAYIAKE